MKRKSFKFGILAAVLTLSAAVGSQRISRTAHSFRQHFQEIQSSGTSLGPVEKIVYSLVLANAPTEQPCDRPLPRT